ncbi:MAG: hypothetical protein AAB873_02230 [Patescibacteria group bacterium]
MYESNENPLIKDTFLDSKYFDPQYLAEQGTESGLNAFKTIFTSDNLEVVYFILSILAIICITIIIYSTIRIFEIRKKQHAHMHHEIHEFAHKKAEREEKLRQQGKIKNDRWRKLLDHLFSTSENDWKLAIIEADSMLFDLLTQLKYKGDTLGDKLKSADRESFHSLSSAWEAHNIRNKIAHDGAGFSLSLHETKRVVALYEHIFDEFGYI